MVCLSLNKKTGCWIENRWRWTRLNTGRPVRKLLQNSRQKVVGIHRGDQRGWGSGSLWRNKSQSSWQTACEIYEKVGSPFPSSCSCLRRLPKGAVEVVTVRAGTWCNFASPLPWEMLALPPPPPSSLKAVGWACRQNSKKKNFEKILRLWDAPRNCFLISSMISRKSSE